MDTSPSSADKTTTVSNKTIVTKKVKSRRRKLPGFVKLLIAVVLIGGAVGGFLLWRAQTSASAAASPTIALAVTQGDLNLTVESNGNVQANTEKSVTYQASGTVTDVLVKSGDKVTAGQVLIKQTDTDQKEALASAQAGLNSAQAKLDDLQKGPSEAAVNSAKADVASAQAALDALTAGSTAQDIADANADLKTAQTELTTVKAGATTKELQDAAADLKTAQTALATLKAGATAKEIQDAQADLTTAQTAYNALKAGPTDQDLKNAQADLLGAQTAYNTLKAGATKQDLTNAQADLDSAQAAYDALTAPPSASDLKEAQSALDAAKANLAALKAQPTAAQLSTAKLAVSKAQASITSIQTQAALDKQTAQLTLDKADRDLAQAQRDYGTIANEVLDEQGNITVPTSNPKYDQYWTAYDAMKDAEQVQTQDLNELNNVIQKEKDDVAAAQATVADANTQLATVQAGATTADLMSAQHDVDLAQKTLDDLTKAPTADALASAKAAVTKAQNALDTLKAGPTADDLATAQTAVTKAQTALDALKAGPTASDLATAQAAVTKAQTALDELKAGPTADDLATAQATLTKAQTAYNELKAEPTANDLATAQSAVDKAQAALTALKNGATPQDIAAAQATLASKQSTLATLIEPATASDIASAQEEVATAQKAVDDANSDLAKTVITAPFSGTIASVTAEPSGAATIGTEALTIYDESGMQLELAVNESDIQSIKVGQSATITLDALPGKVFTGTVSTVSNVSTTSSDVVTYAVSVQFSPGAEPVKTGMSATANIITESHTGVIQVPTRAITTQGREKIVKVLYGTAKTPVTIAVTTGLASSSMTEITSCVDTGNQCLRAGDQVSVTVTAATTTNNTGAQTFPGGGAFPGGTFPGGGNGTFQRGTGGTNR